MIEWGIFRQREEDGHYQQVDSYWGSVVGYGYNHEQKSNTDILIVHDPSQSEKDNPAFVRIDYIPTNFSRNGTSKLIFPEGEEILLKEKKVLKGVKHKSDELAVWQGALFIQISPKTH